MATGAPLSLEEVSGELRLGEWYPSTCAGVFRAQWALPATEPTLASNDPGKRNQPNAAVARPREEGLNVIEVSKIPA